LFLNFSRLQIEFFDDDEEAAFSNDLLRMHSILPRVALD
jgi:hypothetical protein